MGVVSCRACGKGVSPNAVSCPYCGQPSPGNTYHLTDADRRWMAEDLERRNAGLPSLPKPPIY